MLPGKSTWHVVLACSLATGAVGRGARARADETWLLGVDGAAARAVTEPQRELFGYGGGAGLSLRRSLSSWLQLGVRVGATYLGDGSAPLDAGAEDPEGGNLYSASWLLRLRGAGEADAARGTGPWIEAAGGIGMTGDIVRPVGEFAVGWSFEAGPLDVGPFARWVQVIDRKSQLDERDARLVLVGAELSLFDSRQGSAPLGDGDRDDDRIVDSLDRCPDEPEDYDGFEDEDGCRDSDNDRDHILDVLDLCPMMAEDYDGFDDRDGCPDPDNDGDGLADAVDACPNEPETVNGVEDGDGCPDRGLIEMVDDRVVLEEQVLFGFDRIGIKGSGWPTLGAVVELARQHPEWVRLRIEGHADIRGDAEYNLGLSERRAHSVMRALVMLGIEGSIIDAQGYGATRLRDYGSSEEAHQRNRRVEFVVLRRRVDPRTLPATQRARRDGESLGAGSSPPADRGGAR